MSRTTPAASALASELHEGFPDEWLAALSNRQCISLIEELHQSSPPITLEDLAHRVAEREGSHGVPEDTVRDIQISIYHNYLPRLEDVGILTYSIEDGVIETVECFAAAPMSLV